MWTKKYDKCVRCGTIEKKHQGRGYCSTCYNHIPEVKVRKKKFDQSIESKIKKKIYRNIPEVKAKAKLYKETKEYREKVKIHRQLPEIKLKTKLYKETPEYKIKKKIYYTSEEGRLKARLRKKERMKTDIHFRINNIVSSSVRLKLKSRLISKKGKSTWDFLPYTPQQLKEHIEKQFESWMNWDNWGFGKGKWNIDHIKPDCSFKYKEMSLCDKDFQDCWALSNLRPLEWYENCFIKSGKII